MHRQIIGIKKTKHSKNLLIYIALILGVIFTITPFLWMVLTSFKTRGEAMQVPPIIFPEVWQIENYTKIFDKLPFGRIYLNTIISSTITTIAQLVLCSMAGYSFGRIKFPGRDIIFMAFLAILMIPPSLFILPQYLIIQNLKLLDTIPALFIPNLFSAFGTFLLRQFFMSLPTELEEAARLDGCNHFKIYTKVMLPLVKSGLTALGILTFKFAWNDLMWPLIVNSSTSKITLSAALSNLQGQYVTDYPAMMAGSVMAVLPMIAVFAIFQRQFIEGIAMTGTKA